MLLSWFITYHSVGCEAPRTLISCSFDNGLDLTFHPTPTDHHGPYWVFTLSTEPLWMLTATIIQIWLKTFFGCKRLILIHSNHFLQVWQNMQIKKVVKHVKDCLYWFILQIRSQLYRLTWTEDLMSPLLIRTP